MNFLKLYTGIFYRFAKYYFKAKTKYDVHSPFAFMFVEDVLEDSRYYYAFSAIEALWKLQLQDERPINITDYGAGSKVDPKKTRKIKSLAKYSAVSTSMGRMLFRIVHLYKPRSILELGTSLGLSSLYMAAAARRSRIWTIEGCPEISKLAQQNFQTLGMSNIKQLSGSFDKLLPNVLNNIGQLDFLYLDGDHRPEASFKYFEKCLEYAHNNSIFVIADIHWSKEMENAWEAMKKHKKVHLSLDLYQCGLLSFRKEQREEEHYHLIKSKWKPWRIGFF